MTVSEIIITLGGLGLIGLLVWYFFGPKKSSAAQVRGKIQEVMVTIRGGYSPDVIRVKKGIPLRLIFDRREAGDCSSRIVFPDFQVSKTLAPFAKTTLEFTPDKVGHFGFACGMGMLHGTLIVEEDGVKATMGQPITTETIELIPEHAQAVGVGPTLAVAGTSQVEFALIGGGVTCPTCAVNIETGLSSLPGVDDVKVNFGAERITVRYDAAQITPEKMQGIIENTGYKIRVRSQPGAKETEDKEAAERVSEQRDLTRRVIIGAILSFPVIFAVTMHDFFGAEWIPAIFLNRWFQLVLITPVMVYAGWPIH